MTTPVHLLIYIFYIAGHPELSLTFPTMEFLSYNISDIIAYFYSKTLI